MTDKFESVRRLREYLQNAPQEELDARTARVEAKFAPSYNNRCLLIWGAVIVDKDWAITSDLWRKYE